MCGIAGWLAPNGALPDEAILRRMTDAMTRRGPDGSGFHVAPGVGLGHRRLSIVDLAGGGQPMFSTDRSLVTAFNGEIYNHLDLRADLSQLGYDFATHSDTEVLLYGARQWGKALPAKLNGMFAFCVWDQRTGKALFARDRTGKKPLYYAHLPDGTLLFASEIKALVEHPAIGRKIDRTALALYLTYEYVPWPFTAFEGIRKLPPGSLMQWDNGRLSIENWADLGFGHPTAFREPEEWFAEIRRSLSASVKRRLMSDVPLGVFLSGGIDSSAITALMTEHVAPQDIQTFSIAFEDPSFDESRWSQLVARHFGTHHRQETFSVQSLLDALPTVSSLLDEPFADASVLPTFLLSQFTRQHVTVALGGDGGDELFAGYETFRADAAAQIYRNVPAAARSLISRGVQKLPVSTRNFSLDFVAKRFVAGADAAPEFRHIRWLSAFLPNTPNDPLLRSIRDTIPDGDVFGVMARPYLECPDPRHVQRLSWAYIRTYMAEDILTKVDRASMMTSLEVRSPFLDPEFISLVVRMPPHLKLHGFDAKYALKQALRNDLPHDILYRKKKGFGIPVAAWLKGPLSGEVNRLLDPARIEDAGIFDPAVVTRLVQEHRDGNHDHRKALWTLMMFENWRERFHATI